MNKFSIEINPNIPEYDFSSSSMINHVNDIKIENIYQNFPEEYEIIYHILGESYRYYPTDILTILNDLHQEWNFTRNRIDHDMTLVGYTVLQVYFKDEAAYFSNPARRSPSGISMPIGEPIWAVGVEEEFRIATERVLNFIHGC